VHLLFTVDPQVAHQQGVVVMQALLREVGVAVHHLFTADPQVVHQQGVVAVLALLREVGVAVEVEVRMLHQQKLQVEVHRCLEVAGVLPHQQSAAVVHLAVVVCLQSPQSAVVVQVCKAAVEVVLQAEVVAAVCHQHLVAVAVPHLHRAEVLHLLHVSKTCRLQQLGMI